MKIAALDRVPRTVRPRQLHLTIWNVGGSVQHYHHFLLGFLVPLIQHRKRTWQNPAYDDVLLRSCGPMDGLVRQLGMEGIRILDKAEHLRLGSNRSALCRILPGVPFGAGSTRYMGLRGYDYPARYNYAVFDGARSVLRELLRNEIRACTELTGRRTASVAPRILVLQRGEPHPFYLSERSEARHGGSARRSIRNHAALLGEIARCFGNTSNVILEDLSLAEQIALFSSADVVIAQHGAALSNLIWCRPGTIVVEIVPRTLSPDILNVGFFSNLSRCMKLRYSSVWQEHAHSDVDIREISASVRRALSSAP